MSRINGLGAIKTIAVPIPKKNVVAAVVGVPLVAMGVLGSYQAFVHAWHTKSGWAKLGLGIAGLAAGVLTLDGVLLSAMGLGLLPNVSEGTAAPEIPAGQLVGLRRRIRGIGSMVQPDLMVGQDHWLDRQWPDRYSEWWVGPHPRL